MEKFELCLYNPFEEKFLCLLFSFLILFIVGCAKIGPPIPLKEEYEISVEEAIPPLLIYGKILENKDSVGVQKYDESSWINLQFKGEIDTTSSGIKVIDISGKSLQFIREWDVYKDKTLLVLKPSERLDYNMIYLLKITGAGIHKLEGEYVDLDNDGLEGEAIEDDFVFPFVTFKADNSKGDWTSLEGDNIPPFLSPYIEFLVGEKKASYIWTDVDIALEIFDYTWQLADTSVIIGAVDTATVDKNDFKIVAKNSGKEVFLESVKYIHDLEDEDFGKVIIDPKDNLKPQSWYILQVLGRISDMNGNKLGEDDSVVFEKDFVTFNCNHDSTECSSDTVPPEVLNWRNLGPSFEVTFSETIDAESVNDSSIYIPKVEGELSARNECGHTFVRFTTSKRVGVSGYTAFVTGEVKDLAGNKVKEVSHYFERKTD